MIERTRLCTSCFRLEDCRSTLVRGSQARFLVSGKGRCQSYQESQCCVERAALVSLRNLREVTWLRLGWEGCPRGAVAGTSRPRGHGSPGGQTHSTDVEMSKRVFIGIGSCDFWRPKSPKTDHLLAGAPGTMVERPSQGEDH